MIILSLLVPTLFVVGCLYYFFSQVMAQELGLPDVIARHLIPVMERVNLALSIGLPGVFIVLLTLAVILSYKFIAPLERLEEDLEKIDEGDYSVRLQINEDHDLAPVAGIINDLVEKLDKIKRQV